MGGSGGSSSSWNPDRLASMIQQAEAAIKNAEYDSSVSEMLNNKLAEFNNRDTQAIASLLERIKAALSKEVEGIDRILFGGSVAKSTYVEGVSDVDALVVLSKDQLNSANPSDMRHDFAQRLRVHFGRDAVVEGHLAVTVNVGGHEIQLLPAVRTDKHLFITNETGNRWARINPQKFADKLTQENKALNSKLVPTIKLVKGIVSNLPEKMRLSGYHVESLALNAFKGYEGQRSCAAMVKHWFRESAELIKKPIRDISGQSRHVDTYLGDAGSLSRNLASRTLDRIYRQLNNADRGSNIGGWKECFGE